MISPTGAPGGTAEERDGLAGFESTSSTRWPLAAAIEARLAETLAWSPGAPAEVTSTETDFFLRKPILPAPRQDLYKALTAALNGEFGCGKIGRGASGGVSAGNARCGSVDRGARVRGSRA